MAMEDAALQMNGTAEGLIAFLDWTARSGLLSGNTAASYRTAVTKVMEIDGESWQATPVSEVDVDNQLERFTRLRAGRYNPESLTTYGNRFRGAFEHYARYLEDPKNFRAGQAKVPKAKVPSETSKDSKGPKHGTPSPRSSRQQGREDGGAEKLIEYPFPLASGAMAYLSLPRDFRRSDASRIAKFVESLAIDPALELMAGGEV
jgi:hypothetical protein